MFRFFRLFRQKISRQGSVQKYLLYAIGEIVLVVLGILIALGINNWNEARKNQKKERQVAQTLYEELEQNLRYSSELQTQLDQRLTTTVALMGHTANTNTSISAKEFDSLMVRSFIFPTYTPIKADLERVLGSEQIDLIHSSLIQERLADYKTSIDAATLYYRYAEDDFKLLILPFFVKNYPLKVLLSEYGLPVPPTIHERNYKELLASREFENVLSVILADCGGQLEAINANLKLIDNLKAHMEKEYQLETP